jgi:hypothetical protein
MSGQQGLFGRQPPPPPPDDDDSPGWAEPGHVRWRRLLPEPWVVRPFSPVAIDGEAADVAWGGHRLVLDTVGSRAWEARSWDNGALFVRGSATDVRAALLALEPVG